MELGLLDIFGINEACEIALLKYEDIKLQLSPMYNSNTSKLLPTDDIYKIGGHRDGFKKVILDVTNFHKTNIINIIIENYGQCLSDD